MRRIEAVTLDAYGTIFEGGSDELIRILDETRREHRLRASLAELLARREEMIRALETMPFMTMRARDEWIFATLWREHEIPSDPAPLVERLNRAYFEAKPYPEALAEIDALRGAGHRLAIVSNCDDDMMRHLVGAHDLADAFEAVVTSEGARAYKPATAPFEAAAEALRVPPSRIAHAGDSFVADVAGAKRAGYGIAVWIDRGGLPAPAHRAERADHRLDSLTGLASLLAPEG